MGVGTTDEVTDGRSVVAANKVEGFLLEIGGVES